MRNTIFIVKKPWKLKIRHIVRNLWCLRWHTCASIHIKSAESLANMSPSNQSCYLPPCICQLQSLNLYLNYTSIFICSFSLDHQCINVPPTAKAAYCACSSGKKHLQIWRHVNMNEIGGEVVKNKQGMLCVNF